MVLSLIFQARIDFYPITQSISLYDYEVVLLSLLLAPFIYALPSTSHRGLTAMRKVYWVVFALLMGFITIGSAIIILISARLI
jgi:hypothetical protein